MIGAILDGCYKINPTKVEDYIEIGGFKALKKAINMEPLSICDEIKKSNLKGRGGGGQPYDSAISELVNKMKKIYSIDKNKVIRKSHENPNIIKIYNEYLEKPGSHNAEELLHTKYFIRKK